MKLLIVGHPPFRVGGVSSMLRWLYSALAQINGIEPTILCAVRHWPEGFSWESGEIAASSPEVRRFSFNGFDTLAVPYNGRLMRGEIEILSQAFDRVHEMFDAVQVVSGASLLGLGPLKAKRKFVMWMATTLDEENAAVQRFGLGWKFNISVLLYYLYEQRRFREWERLILDRCDSVCCISKYTTNMVLNEFGVPEERCRFLPIPISDDVLSKAESEPVRGRILTAGRLHDPRKDVETLIKALSIVISEVPEAKLVLMGSDTIPKKIVALIEKLGINQSIEVTGHVEDPLQEYRKADIGVISSLQEGLNITGLESLAHRAPVVSTTCGGPESYVIPDKTGILVPKSDPDAMAEALLKLILDRDLRDRMGLEGRQLVENEFNETKALNSFLEEYERVFGFSV